MRPFHVAAALGTALLSACAASPPPLHGTVFPSPSPAPPFTLTDQAGHSFSLRSERGSVVALYFGFTHCKDICPQTLTTLGAAVRASHVPNARILFVSVDPRHDSPRALANFIARVGVPAVGLTGSREELAPVWHAYGVTATPRKDTVLHSTYVYLIDPQGREREILDADAPVKVLATDIHTLAQSGVR